MSVSRSAHRLYVGLSRISQGISLQESSRSSLLMQRKRHQPVLSSFLYLCKLTLQDCVTKGERELHRLSREQGVVTVLQVLPLALPLILDSWRKRPFGPSQF